MEYIFFSFILLAIIGMINKKSRRFSLIFILLIMLILLVLYPTESIYAAKNGINLWLFVVVPSLFPFFIINDILICLKVPENIARIFTPMAKFLFNTSGYGAYTFIMSIFSGYPSGAKIVSSLIRDKKIRPNEGQQILTFASTSGPLFIIGAVGAGMLKSPGAGYVLFLCHLLGAIINGILFKYLFIWKRENEGSMNYVRSSSDNSFKTGDILTSSIAGSLSTCGIIGGYIVFFSVIISMLERINFFETFSVLLNRILFVPYTISNSISTIFKSSMEISNGCKIISATSMDFKYKLLVSSFLIAFSGISIIGQVGSLVKAWGISIKKYVFSKLSHGIISSVICYFILSLNILSIPTLSQTKTSLGKYEILLIELLLLLILFINSLAAFLKRKSSY